MKKIFFKITALLLVLCFSFCGCGKEKEPEIEEIEPLTITSKEYEEWDIKIVYPVFEGGKTEARDRMNASIFQNVRDEVETITNKYAGKKVIIEAEYEIKLKDEEKVSFLYKGTVKVDDEESLFLSGFTMSTKEARQLTIGDIVTFDDTFPQSVKNGKITDLEGKESLEAKELIDKTDDLEIIDGIRVVFGEYSFYLKESSVIIIFPVPHENGDYALSEIELK